MLAVWINMNQNVCPPAPHLIHLLIQVLLAPSPVLKSFRAGHRKQDALELKAPPPPLLWEDATVRPWIHSLNDILDVDSFVQISVRKERNLTWLKKNLVFLLIIPLILLSEADYIHVWWEFTLGRCIIYFPCKAKRSIAVQFVVSVTAWLGSDAIALRVFHQGNEADWSPCMISVAESGEKD